MAKKYLDYTGLDHFWTKCKSYFLGGTSPEDVADTTNCPKMDGTKTYGTSHILAREDHVHPTDTSRAPLASPAFTGNPTAPTQSTSDDSTKLATTAFVHDLVDGISPGSTYGVVVPGDSTDTDGTDGLVPAFGYDADTPGWRALLNGAATYTLPKFSFGQVDAVDEGADQHTSYIGWDLDAYICDATPQHAATIPGGFGSGKLFATGPMYFGTTSPDNNGDRDIIVGVNDVSSSSSGLMSSTDKAKLDALSDGGCWYGTSSTSAGTVAKVVTCADFTLKKGSIIAIYFSTANTASTPTLNVNSTGAKSIHVGNSEPNATTNVLKWSANTLIFFMYDGTQYKYLSSVAAASVAPPRGANTWYGSCSTSASATAKTATIDNFVLTKGAVVVLQMTTANTVANSALTLNVNSTGAKTIYVGNAATSSSVNLLWSAGSVHEFVYDGTYWRWIGEKLQAGNGLSMTQSNGAPMVEPNLVSINPLDTAASSSTDVANRTYPVALDDNKNLAVNVPWTDTDTTYSDFTGATSSTAGAHGLVPAPASGDQWKILFGDAFWKDLELRKYNSLGRQNFQLEADWYNGSATAGAVLSVLYPDDATSSCNGFMSASDKAKLDSISMTNGVIDASVLPSYVDDVIEAYPRSGQTELGSTWLSATSGGSALTPETGKIYILMGNTTNYSTNDCFRWSGSTFVKLYDGGVSSITNAEIDTIVANPASS